MTSESGGLGILHIAMKLNSEDNDTHKNKDI